MQGNEAITVFCKFEGADIVAYRDRITKQQNIMATPSNERALLLQRIEFLKAAQAASVHAYLDETRNKFDELMSVVHVAKAPKHAEQSAEAEASVEEVRCPTCGAGETDRMSVKCKGCDKPYWTKITCEHCRDPADIQRCYACCQKAQKFDMSNDFH